MVPADPYAHELRAEIRDKLEVSKAMTVRELSEELDEPVARISYHLSVLFAAGAIEADGTDIGRLYKLVRGDPEDPS